MSHYVYSREEWGAAYGRGNATSGAKRHFVIHHDTHSGRSRSRPEMTIADEIKIMQLIEAYHVNGEPGRPGLTHANPRIAYTFVVMQSGRLFEGTGWGRIGAHTGGLNSSAYALFYPLNGNVDGPTREALAAQHWLRSEGVRLGHLSPTHELCGHQDHGKPSCPGAKLYAAAVRGAHSVPALVVAAKPSLRLGKGGAGASEEERAAVRYLQSKLIRLALLEPTLPSGKSAATGNFGPRTDAAVRKLQTVYGKEVDGLVGPQTWALIESL